MNVLVTGGAGYIGSHMVRALVAAKHHVVVVDDLSSGHADAVAPGVPLVKADIRDEALAQALREHKVEAVFHFASRIQVGESMVNPRLYFKDNLAAGITLVERVLDAKVGYFILSSTAAVYGNPVRTPIDEDHPTVPVNPYGETKLATERMLFSYARAYGLKFAALRYFNAAGAGAGLAERHDPETHLIPLVLDAALGKRPNVQVFGSDYPTPDGTCVRDYIHVEDLAEAHLAALLHLTRGGDSGAFNLGTGKGNSVREVVGTASRVTGVTLKVAHGPRREGDPPVLVASAERAKKVLGWQATRSSLDRIIEDAWEARRGAHTP
jgi:UDP-glucose 4-epimerase